jgi:D-serine deaminase-like pyridoxal phosphate-dependent protein
VTSPTTMPWYTVDNVADVPSPALLVYPERIAQNIRTALQIVGDARRLRPHLKTCKMGEVVRMHLDEGITRFKCATIAEAEMAARAGALDVLLAYQPVGPNVARFVRLVQTFPATRFAAIVDDTATVDALSAAAGAGALTLDLFIDLDGGMHRSGIAPGPGAVELYRRLSAQPGLRAAGLHMYDGHVKATDVDARRRASDEAFAHVATMRQAIEAAGLDVPSVVVGGTPAFPFHAQRAGVECSPGTTVFWDAGYGATLPDLPFVPAAALLTRVISRPSATRLCLDLGHKAVASENPHPRVVLFGLEDATAVGHSEEHLVLETDRAAGFPVGSALYGVPWHVCPTVALYNDAIVVRDGRADGRWQVAARGRSLTI